ncbi:MAG: Ig-like domain-containing protein, partial [Candidatus Berkiella sp.]
DSFDLKSLPANGILYTDVGLTTVAVINTDYPAVANQLVLYFVPALNFNGDVTFNYAAKDDLGLASTADGTATITVISVNDAPVVNNVNASGNEDAASISITLTGSDVDGTIASFDLKNLPANGILYIDATLTTAALINTDYPAVANQLVLYFAPALNFNGDVAFEYGAKDNTGDVSASTAVATISVASVNDAPAGTDTTVVVNEDTQYIFSAANFGFSDINDNPANSLLAVRITTLPGAGMLTNNGIPVMVGSFISIADINAGILRFNPAANANGIGYSSFTFQVRDNGGTANGGVDLDPNPKTITIDVMAVNDAPVVNNIEGDILNYPLGMLGTAQILDQGALATVLDVDSADFDGGVLTVEITANAAPAEDELGIQSTVGQIELTGSSVTYAGTEIGVLDAASTAIRLLINLNSDATPVSVAALISAITYTNTELVLPDVTARTVSFTVTDGDGGTSNTGNILVDVGDILPPVVLDLDGDGIELISAQNSNVSVEKNGMHYKVGWVGPNDAILAYDANHDGLVTDLSEINLTLYHPDAKTDLEGLKLAFDSNQDGIFDAADEHFKDFLIWQDRNQDGISQASEVTPLADSHIKAIHLNSDNHLEKIDGNIIFGTTTYETKQGEIFLASDLGLAVLPVQSPSALTLSDVLVLESTEDPIREMEEGSGLYQPVLPSLSEIMPEIDTFTHLI